MGRFLYVSQLLQDREESVCLFFARRVAVIELVHFCDEFPCFLQLVQIVFPKSHVFLPFSRHFPAGPVLLFEYSITKAGCSPFLQKVSRLQYQLWLFVFARILRMV